MFKHDNPSTNTNPFDVEQALNDNWDKIDTVVGEMQEEQTTQNEDIEFLQEENANFKAQIPQGQAEGEEISLSDSAKMELVEFGLQGNSKQETTKGLQILENTNEGATGWNSSVGNGALNLTSIIKDGINCAKFAVTEAITSYCVLYRNANLSKLKNNTTYTLQLDVKASKTGFLYSAIQTTGANNQIINFVGKSYTTAGQWQTLKMIATSNSVVISNQVLYFSFNNLTDKDDYIEFRNVILAEGDYSEQDLEWEKYTGVEASPNLDYQREVEAIGDNLNIFDKDVEILDGYLSPDGGWNSSTTTGYTKSYQPIEANKEYILSGLVLSSDNSRCSIYRLYIYDKNKNMIEKTASDIKTLEYKFTTPQNAAYIDYQVDKAAFSDSKNNIKLEEGTVATLYSPYNQGSIEIIKSNKNLLLFGYDSVAGITFNKNKVTIKNPTSYNYCEIFNLKDNKILSGKKVAFTYVFNGLVTGDNYVDLIFNSNKRNYIVQKQANKTHGTYTNEIFTKTITFADDEYLTSCCLWTAGTTCDITIDVQIEISDESTELIEHEGNIYAIPIQKPFYKLINIGDNSIIYDAFIKQNNKWYEKHIMSKANLENFEWQLGAVQTGTNIETSRWNSTTTLSSHTGGTDRFSKCNCLVNRAGQLYGTDKIGFSTEGNLVNIRLPKTIATTTTQVKEYFESLADEVKEAYIIYPLATPELIECTAEQTQILEQIVKDGTYKEVTHFYSNEDLKPTLELKYYKDLEILFNKQAELENTLNNVQAQLLELGGN